MTYVMPTGIGNMTSFMQWGNSTMDGYLGILVLLSFFIISFTITVWKTEAGNAYTFAMIITTFMAIFFKIIGIINGLTLFICFIATGIGFVIISKSKSPY